MGSTVFPNRYHDPVYQDTHHKLFSKSLTRPLESVLPPSVKQADFDLAISDYVSIVGKDAVFTGKALEGYIDPYELHEAEEAERKVPSAAVWSVTGILVFVLR